MSARAPQGPEPPGLAFYRDALPEGERAEVALDGLDRFGAPVWSASLWPGTAGEAGGRGGVAHGVGYGPTDGEALRGAYGELAETFAVAAAIPRLERRHGSHRALVRELGRDAVLDPRALSLPAGCPYDHDRELTWVAAARRTGGEVWVPVEQAASDPGDLPAAERDGVLFTPITNGLGAGESLERALAHGLLELLQRDGNSVTYRALDRGVGVELDAVADPTTRATLERLDAAGLEVLVKLAADDFGMANLYVVGYDRDAAQTPFGLMATSCGEAVHPDRERALGKALHEYLSSRARKAFFMGPLELVERVAPANYLEHLRAKEPKRGEERALRTMLGWLELDPEELRALMAPRFHAVRSTRALSTLPSTPIVDDPAVLLEDVAGRLEAAGLEVLWVDLSPADGPLRVVKAIVPGLEVETATYHRIGPRNLRRLVEAEEGLVGIATPPPPGARPVLLTDAGREALGGDAWLDPAAVDRAVGRLYPLYREPDRHVPALLQERGLA